MNIGTITNLSTFYTKTLDKNKTIHISAIFISFGLLLFFVWSRIHYVLIAREYILYFEHTKWQSKFFQKNQRKY